MSNMKWGWGTAPQEPFLGAKDLPAERLVIWYDPKTKAQYWAAYRKHKQVNGNRLPQHFDTVRDIHFIHMLQVVLGYGPVYLKHVETEYYKLNLFLVGYDEVAIESDSYYFDPNDV